MKLNTIKATNGVEYVLVELGSYSYTYQYAAGVIDEDGVIVLKLGFGTYDAAMRYWDKGADYIQGYINQYYKERETEECIWDEDKQMYVTPDGDPYEDYYEDKDDDWTDYSKSRKGYQDYDYDNYRGSGYGYGGYGGYGGSGYGGYGGGYGGYGKARKKEDPTSNSFSNLTNDSIKDELNQHKKGTNQNE